eukprot:177220_1
MNRGNMVAIASQCVNMTKNTQLQMFEERMRRWWKVIYQTECSQPISVEDMIKAIGWIDFAKQKELTESKRYAKLKWDDVYKSVLRREKKITKLVDGIIQRNALKSIKDMNDSFPTITPWQPECISLFENELSTL